MRVLVTNDDGIESVGIQVLAAHLADAGHEVVVVAPDRDYSGSGAALGDLKPDVDLPVRKVELAGRPDIEAWALAGAPALTVVAGMLGAFGPAPEVVVSGINAGLNTGRSVLHSGTVGAALTAQNFGISGLAVSTAVTDPWHWDTAAAIAVDTLELLARGPARSVINLNVPGLPRDEVLGVRWARLAPFGAVRAAVSSRDDERLQFELTPTGYEPEPDTDQGSVQAGWASLTTLAGVVEAWPVDEAASEADLSLDDLAATGFEGHIEPGAPLHPVHEVPDASNHRFLRRPSLGS